MDPDSRRVRATLAATRRHHPDADTTELEDELERARIDARIDELVRSAPKMTTEQAARLGHLFRYAPAEAVDGG